MLITASLAAQIAAFAGQPVTLDARLDPPPCTQPLILAWVPPGRGAVGVTCAAPRWQLFVPLAAPAPPQRATPLPLYRRGDIVAVAAAGPGFSVAVEAVVDADAEAGARLRLHNRATGEHLQAVVGANGDISLPGYNGGGGGR